MPNNSTDLKVGVLGGMGPYATCAFMKCILDKTPVSCEADHLHLIIDNNPRIPSRTRAFMQGGADPVPMMISSAQALLAAGADILVMPCNSAHFFLPAICEAQPFPFINMIEETAKFTLSQGTRTAGVIAGEVTVKAELYEQVLGPKGVNVLQVSDEEQKLVRAVIEDVKKNVISAGTVRHLAAITQSLESRGADTIVLGCTELPLVAQHISTPCLIVDSMLCLAEALIRRAKRLEHQ
jgi:aspartate racemase